MLEEDRIGIVRVRVRVCVFVYLFIFLVVSRFRSMFFGSSGYVPYIHSSFHT